MAGIYLHIPFCEHKCIYCDFYSLENTRHIDTFLSALTREIGMYGARGDETIETVFLGGGTPSLLTAAQLELLLSTLNKYFSISSDAEVTLETNPGTVDAQRLSDFRSVGINRLSVGIQSFHDDDLRFLTRIHSSDQAVDCVRSARKAGFQNISVDLIFALPGQTVERWASNVQSALQLETQHISAYSLIVEPGTPLARMVASRQVSPLPNESDAELYEMTMDMLGTAGFEHYEVSNYAMPGFRSRHNANYWNHTNYIGFGPSAHSYWNQTPVRAERWWNVRNLKAYLEKLSGGDSPIMGREQLGSAELLEEAVMLGLRCDGIDLRRFKERFGCDLGDDAGDLIAEYRSKGLVLPERGVLRLTDRGYLLCDAVVESVLAQLGRVERAA